METYDECARRYAGRMLLPEKPWIVVTIGAAQCRENASGSQSRWLCTRSNSPERRSACATWIASHTRPSRSGLSSYPVGATPSSVALVTESSVANSVTSTPRAARPSASSPATVSHGP
jgi:hypothetical protein